MKLSRQVKPISYLRAHAPEVVRSLAGTRERVVLTVHDEVKAALQDGAHDEEIQETLAYQGAGADQ